MFLRGLLVNGSNPQRVHSFMKCHVNSTWLYVNEGEKFFYLTFGCTGMSLSHDYAINEA